MKIREDKIVKKGLNTTFKKTKKLIIFSRGALFMFVLFARQVNTHYIAYIEPFLLQHQWLAPDKVQMARELVKKGYMVAMVISYLPTIFISLKYSNEEEKAKANLNTYHNILNPIKKDRKGRVVYKVKKVKENKLEHLAMLELLKEFAKIRKERLKNKTPFSEDEFRGFVKIISKNNPTIKKYLEAQANNPDVKTLDWTDLYYKWREKLDKYKI